MSKVWRPAIRAMDIFTGRKGERDDFEDMDEPRDKKGRFSKRK